ncbi:MAG TPA: J domain-containing protein [Candidatus Nanoarchaeia archaeon]|nr:J domain-containing protein [Candidatus Nanoarchaeia archaeon]
MSLITVKGHDFHIQPIKDSFSRRAVQLQNTIIATLRKIGLTEDDVNIDLEAVAIKKAPASVSWYFNGYHLHYSYQRLRFIDNLSIVSKVIDLFVGMLVQRKLTENEFIHEFSEDTDIQEQRKEARELLGVPEDSIDVKLIDAKYKEFARKYHPDTGTGDVEKFKAINRAHKMLKRELE